MKGNSELKGMHVYAIIVVILCSLWFEHKLGEQSVPV